MIMVSRLVLKVAIGWHPRVSKPHLAYAADCGCLGARSRARGCLFRRPDVIRPTADAPTAPAPAPGRGLADSSLKRAS